jgi:S-adenosylmethionine:tRNA ribosyltransferase-isomerase
MEETKHIHISDFDYDLPDERIAKYPVAVRDQSKLLLYNHGELSDHIFTSLPDFLPEGSLMVFNNTKVIQARLHFRKETGALIEIFCLEPYLPNDYQLIFEQRHSCQWLCLIGNRKKWKDGKLSRTIRVGNEDVTLWAEDKGSANASDVIEFSWDGEELTFAEILDAVGELPIPPYLNRKTEESDKQTYQTVYSKIEGSVAAPTAGLHFTERVLEAIDRKGIERDEITLHVGAGTFKPVKSVEIEDHEMHSEYIFVPRTSVEKLIQHGGRCTAVGTTSVRTLESLYYIGVKLIQNPLCSEEQLFIEQWMPYDLSESLKNITTMEALQAVLDYLDLNDLKALHTSTQIIIAPGYHYHIVERMVTNFHMPKSTLLLLVSAFIGDDWRKVYAYALNHNFRFLSYGDSSLLIP